MGSIANLRALIGSGDRIALFTAPFVGAGLALQARFPSLLAINGTPRLARPVALAVLSFGMAIWASSVALIVTKVPKGELITVGPYALAKHPLYTSVALLVLPAIGFLRGTWLGAVFGLALYAGSRRYAPAEEEELAATFGPRWESYRRHVLLPWL